MSRTIDGLGFRYHWASKNLTDDNLKYKTTGEARTIRQTLEHIHGLSEVILNTVKNEPTIRPFDWSQLTYDELRIQTLEMIQEASQVVRSTESDFDEMVMTFQRGESSFSFPFWNLLNGQLADAIYHTGQITTLRRAAGNPIDQRISVLQGKVKEE